MNSGRFGGKTVMQRKNKEAYPTALLLAVAISLSTFGCGGAPAPNPVPVAVSLSPNTTTAQGPAFTLTVNGSGFVPASLVQWKGSSRTTTFVNSGQLTAQIGASDVAAAGQIAVTVFNPSPGGGTSGPVVLTILAPNPVPVVSAVSPNLMTAQGGAFTLTVNGSGFVPASVVQWNSSSRATTFVNSGQLTAQIGASDLALAGQAAVTVSNPSPGGGTSGALAFTILAPIAFSSNRALDGSDAIIPTTATFIPTNVWLTQGSSAVRLTLLNNAFANFQVWSPDGRKLAFESNGALDGSNAPNTNNTTNIWVMNADGSGVTPLTRLTAANADSGVPEWSPDGSKIVFESGRALDGTDSAGNTLNIWTINADGSGAAALTKLTASRASSNYPVWSPDGRKIAFISDRALDGTDSAIPNLTSNIWVANADGSGVTPLTKLTTKNGGAFSPAWSLDGSKIAFDSYGALDGSDNSNGTTANIWVVNVDGSGATALTKLTASNASSFIPVWSPDGSKIAFVSQRALEGSNSANTINTLNIWTMNADGSGAAALTRFTAANVFSQSSAWSPDGHKIAFISDSALDGSDALNANRALNLWVINADGTGAIPLTKLTASGLETVVPQWQP